MLCRLLQAFATVFYGCQLWNCNDNQLRRLCVAWNDAIRRICNVRRGCHVDTMLYATGLLSLPVLLRKRKLQFMSSLLGSKNGVVAYVSSMLYGSLRSSFFVMLRMGVTLLCISHKSFVKTVYSSRCLELLCVLGFGSKMFCCGFGPSMAFEIFL